LPSDGYRAKVRKVRASLHSSLITVLAIAGLFAACTNAAGPMDGWWLGERFDCSNVSCARSFTVAAAALDRRHPGHAPIVESALRGQPKSEPDHQPGHPNGCGGCGLVVVFTLSDGSTRAIGIGTSGAGDPVAFDWGPALNGEPPGQSTEPRP
jgi:hypothetical protein